MGLIVVSSLALPSAALAQPAGQPTNRPPPGPVGRATQLQESWRFESEATRRRSMTPEEIQQAEEEYGAERLDFARRVAELVEQGKCREARDTANEAGERQMALRFRQTCRAR